MTIVEYGSEVTWTIVDVGTGATVCSGGPYPDDTNSVDSCCINPGTPYTLNCIDLNDDGWNGWSINIEGDDTNYCSGFTTGSLETQNINISTAPAQTCDADTVTMTTA